MKKHIILLCICLIGMIHQTGCGSDDGDSPLKIESVTITNLDKDGKFSILKGESKQVAAKILPQEAGSKFMYESGNTNVMTVSSTGVIKAIDEGEAVLTVKAFDDQSISAKATVTVYTTPVLTESLSFTQAKDGTIELEINKTLEIEVEAKPADIANTERKFESSDKTIFTINESTGEVTGVALGTAKLKVSALDGSDVTKECFIKVIPENLLIACGGEQVYILDANKSDTKNLEIVWEWKSSDVVQSGIPAIYSTYLPALDECKVVDNNSKVLLTGGKAAVLLDRKTKQGLFYAYTPNAHSADFLPNNKVVVALSVDEGGNRLQVYDISKSEQPLFSDELYSAHGVVWNAKRERLYALGYDQLREYSLKGWNTDSPSLKLENEWSLPDNDGHDLSLVSEDKLLVSTARSVFWFDIGNAYFSPFEPLKNVGEVKSVNYNGKTGQLVYTKAEESFWTYNIYMKQPDKTIHVPDVKLYKARMIANSE